MKALVICSVHALCDISQLERQACNHAFSQHGMPEILSAQNQKRILETTTMLELLNHLPASTEQRRGVIGTFLDMLNDNIWNASLRAHRSVFATLLNPKSYARPIGFVSEYPMLTTNLVRSAALLTNATKLGQLTTLSDPFNVQSVAAGLEATAYSLNKANNEIEVLVARQRDFAAAQSLGMHPRFIEELWPETNPYKKPGKPRAEIPGGAAINSMPIPEAVAVPA